MYISIRRKILFIVFIISGNISLLAQNQFDSIFKSAEKSLIHKINLEFKDSLNNKTNLPVVIIKGKEEGTVFSILSGVHGAELAPIIATQELIRELDPNKLKGTLIVVPITNIGSFYNYTPFINPLDNRNMNNVFPGKKEGTVSEKIAHFISTKIIPVSDVFLDAHSGDSNEDLLPFVCYYENKKFPEQTKAAKELSEESGFEYVISYPYTIADHEPAKYAFKQACQSGKIALSFESGKLGYVQKEAVKRIKRGYYRIFDKLSLYDFKDPLGKPKFKELKPPIYIDSKVQGLLYSNFKAGDKVIEGYKLGYITNAFGETINEVFSPVSGTIIYMKGVPPTNIDDTLFSISPN